MIWVIVRWALAITATQGVAIWQGWDRGYMFIVTVVFGFVFEAAFYVLERRIR